MKKVMQKWVLVLAVSFVVASANTARADESLAEANYKAAMTLNSVSVREVVPSAEELASDMVEQDLTPGMAVNFLPSHLSLSAMEVLGQKIINIIKAGAAVVDVKRDVVSVVPAGISDWRQLAGWKAPVTKVYAIQMTNLYGSTMVDVRVKLSAMAGGNYNGQGQYLANVLLVPTQVFVGWGWNLDLWTENREPVNTGTSANPVAGLGVDVRYKVKTLFFENQGAQDYWVTGAGLMQAL